MKPYKEWVREFHSEQMSFDQVTRVYYNTVVELEQLQTEITNCREILEKHIKEEKKPKLRPQFNPLDDFYP